MSTCAYRFGQAIVEELQRIAADLQGHLEEPSLRWKFAWVRARVRMEAGQMDRDRFAHLQVHMHPAVRQSPIPLRVF
jgi:hypothetical protein